MITIVYALYYDCRNSSSVLAKSYSEKFTLFLQRNKNISAMADKSEVWKAEGRAMDTNTNEAQDTRADPNSWETRLVRKRWDIGLLRALSLWIMMMMMNIFASYLFCNLYVSSLFLQCSIIFSHLFSCSLSTEVNISCRG